jgi:nickel/cobalt transporter (NiCoT) family protein
MGTLGQVRAGGAHTGVTFDLMSNGGGLLSRLFRPLFGVITKSWHMFPLGFLFGLGFDTATEVALLGISATNAARGVSIWSIMVFPALFAAGMSLIDTSDGILMLGAYLWAFEQPVRRLYCNLTITLVSVVVAILIAGVEALRMLGDQLGLSGEFWQGIAALSRNSSSVGVAIFVWIGAIIPPRRDGRAPDRCGQELIPLQLRVASMLVSKVSFLPLG